MKTFNALNVSSKFAICGLPLRVDTYKTCNFGCAYCFANCRKIMEFKKTLQIGNIEAVKRKLDKVLGKGVYSKSNYLESLIHNGITWHCGGMSDPFQPIEKELGITKKLVDICNQYGVHILFSTKSDTTYEVDIRPQLHSFQLSITNAEDRRDIEANVPSIQNRLAFFKRLKEKGFKVGIRIQPFIPNITTLRILELFKNADNVTIEGLKLVPQNKAHKEYMLKLTGLSQSDFTQMGLLNLKPTIRLRLYQPFIDFLEKHKIPYSIADNDLRFIGTNKCCCGDRLVSKSEGFSTTEMIMKYGRDYSLEEVLREAGEYCECVCNHLFTSNRQEGCKSVREFYEKRFDRPTSPFSPKYQYKEDDEQPTIFECGNFLFEEAETKREE